MSKFIAEKTFRMTNENNDLMISYVVHGLEKEAAMLAYEETKNSEKKLEVEVKPYRSKRSLEQNKLLWVLLGKLAMAMSGRKNKVSSEEAYWRIISGFISTETILRARRSSWLVYVTSWCGRDIRVSTQISPQSSTRYEPRMTKTVWANVQF